MKKIARSVGTTARIRKLLEGLRDGELFSSQDLLECGSRFAVDKAIERAVSGGRIQRIERGLFCKIYNGGLYKFNRTEVWLYKQRSSMKKRS